MSRKSAGFRLDLGEPLAGQLADFCAAHYRASQTEVIREALRQFIEARLAAEPEVKKRYEAAKRKRLGSGDQPIKLVKSDSTD